MEVIIGSYTIKKYNKTQNYYGPPDVYLGTKIHKFRHPDADEDEPHCWSMSGNHDVKNIIANIEEGLNKHGQ